MSSRPELSLGDIGDAGVGERPDPLYAHFHDIAGLQRDLRVARVADAGRKSAEAVAFFGSWSPDQRARFVRANGIDYVLAPDPAAVVRLAGDPELRRVDRQGPMALFKVMP